MKIASRAKEETLTIEEEKILNDLELIITKNFKAFYEVGCALVKIKDSKLYRNTHATFEDYCRTRFEVSRQSAYQYIAARETMDILSARCGQNKLLPVNEAQARPLTRLAPDAQVDAWEEVVKSAPFDGGITAKHVSEVVAGLIGKEIKKKATKIKEKVMPVVSKEFTTALWALIEVIRIEVAKPMKIKMRENMRDSIRRVENLLG